MQTRFGKLAAVGCVVVGCFLSSLAFAQTPTPVPPCGATGVGCVTAGLQQANGNAGFSAPTGAYALVANLINVILGLCGIIFIGIIIWSGAQFFISQGNADRIKSAKSTLIWAAIGLVVIVAAYAGTLFLFQTLLKNLTAG